MSPAGLLVQLHDMGARLWLEDDSLRVSAPRGVLTQELMNELRTHRDEIREWLKRHGDGRRNSASLKPRPRPQRLPLSYAQRRLWFLYRMEGANPVYNIPMPLHLEGDLDVVALEHAIADVAERHESLRTVFPEHEGFPYQLVLAAGGARPELQIESCTEAELSQRLTAAAATAIHLDCEIPLKVWLFRLGDLHHVLLLLLHHIAGDGWSLEPLARDVERAYTARCQGRSPEFRSLPVQYGDYTLWQREFLGDENDAGSVIAKQLDFWRTALVGMPEELRLPVDRRNPPPGSHRAGLVKLQLDEEVHRQLFQIGQRCGASLFMVLQAGLATLLWKLGAGADIPLGTVAAGRSEEALEDLVGFFVNTLVMRTEVSGALSFRDLVKRVRESALEAYAHQDVPFERLVEALQPERSLTRHPLVQVMLVLQNVPVADLDLPGLMVRPAAISARAAKFDLTFSFAELFSESAEPQGLEGELEYDSEIFDHSTAEAMAARLVQLLTQVAASPDSPVYQVQIVSERERLMLLEHFNDEFNASMPSKPAVSTLVTEFESQVLRAPGAVVLTQAEQTLTWKELNDQANRLAHYLLKAGTKPGSLVGIAMDRSPEMVVAMIAILKAGAAYLPLDPDYPQERIEYMVTDAEPVAVIAHRSLGASLRQGLRVIALDDPKTAKALAEMAPENPRVALWPESPAYVIYTSGSTGVPKGVVVTHAGVTRLFTSTRPWFEFGPHDVWTLFHSYAFDFSVWEIFGALLHGGRLVVPSRDITRSPSEFLRLLAEERVTVLNQTPSAFYQLMRAEEENPALAKRTVLRAVIFGGEALDLRRLNSWYARHRKDESVPVLVNMYGITETTVHVSYQRLTEEMARTAEGSLIGANIPDLRVYVLDEYLQLVPPGIAGEIYVSGAGLAQGYLRRAGLTAERFVADLFSAEAGARMYRSGDRARWKAPGVLEYLGRSDQQVKIRGFRIELGEIESVLRELSGVAEAVVIDREQSAGDHRLIAYVVPAKNSPPDAAELRQQAAKRLPEYMIPAAFVTLERLPLTPNGKLDRRSLPDPEVKGDGYEAPRTPTEEVLCALFAQVLGAERVGIHDSFFDLGGHSLLAARLASQVRSALGVDLAIRTLFENPHVAELSKHLGSAAVTGPALEPMARPERMPLSYAQQRLWFLYHMKSAGEDATYNIPLALRLEGDLDVAALKQALADVVARHESLRTIFPEHEGVPYQKILPIEQAAPQLSVERCSDEKLSESLSAAAAVVIHLDHEIPLKAWLFERSAHSHVLLLVLHHIAGDGWSLGPLARDVERAYEMRQQGRAPDFSPLPVQYGDYTLWQRALLGEESDAGGVMKQQMDFWRNALAGIPEEITLPTDRRRPAVGSYRGGLVSVHLDSELHRGLVKLAHTCGASLFMVLQAGFATLLWKMGAGEDIPIGTVTAGRSEEALADLVGFFVNTLVMRAEVSGDLAFTDLVKQVREFALRAYAHQDVPFERLVEALQPERSLARHPLVQVMLVLQNAPEAGFDPEGLTVRPQPLAESTAKFDLTLNLGEQRSGHALEGMEGYLEYSLDLFDRVTAEAMVERLLRLLRQVVASPEVTLYRFDILGEMERRALLEDFNKATHSVPQASSTIVASFEDQVSRTPQASALTFAGESLSYSELNERANRLAHCLLDLEVRPGSLVGIALDRSLEMVIAIVATLKAGAGYLPLDPDYPRARIDHMLRDAAPVAVICNSTAREFVPAATKALILNEDEPETYTMLSRFPAENPAVTVSPWHPAYVIYTSGSTGTPKGVVVTHGNVTRLFAATRAWFDFGPDDVWTLFHSYAFDFSVWEIWGALLHGGRLVVVPREVTRSPSEFLRLLAAERITALNQTPSAFYQLMLAEEEDPARAEQLALRAVIFGGEALDLRRLRGWYARHEEDGPVLVNMYGITETTVHVTYRRLTEEMARTSEGSVIGGNIPDLRVYVLDRYLQPAPMGVTGEIYVSGAGLAQGYLNRAGLTAERFVADPFSHEPGARMYRSGDVGRWRRDGVLEYSGRADQQVKIRGFRIELGEIEEALRHQAGVAAVAVVAREETSGGQRLVAYVVPVKGSELEIAELKREAAKRLPEYMVPAAFVFLEKLPLTANGKLDRRSLPDPEMKGDAWEAPRNPREEVLCGLFAEVLGAERVGIHDNFFDLGGHSLLAARLVSHVRAALKVELALRTLFESPTVAELAGRLNELQEASRPPLVPQPRPERLPLSYVQQRLWFVHKLEGSNASYNIPVAGRMKGELDPRALEQALWDVFNRHESLRSVFPDHDGVPCQQVLPAEMARPPLPVESLTEEELQDRLDAVVANCCIQLEEELPLKAWLFRVGPDDHVLLFIMHHIMSDGWSLAPLARDLQQAYHARLRGEAPAFKELPVQYADYTLWQRSLLGDESDGRGVPAGQMEFWKKALAGAPEEIDLPAPAVRPARGSHATEIIPISFDADLHKDVLALARACGATLFMVLQAGLAALLSRLGAGDDIPVGTIVAGRADAALDDLIGLFINTLVMRTDVSGNPGFAELVKRVRSFALEAYANQDIPFERLVEELRPLRSTIRHPLFQVMLVLQNTPEVALDPGWQALQIDPLAGEEGRLARYDISVSLSEDRDADGSARGIRGHLEYRVDLLDRATALAIAERLIRLLKQAVADPGAPLSRLDILSPEERRTLLYEFNATTLDVPAATIPDLFEAQAARAPQSDAVIFNGESMSYGELNERANRLAHLLIGNGAGPESLVGIALERSSLMMVAIFAVLKAGAAYLPLDPAYPQARLAHMIGEARPGIILTTSNVVRGLPPAEGTQILELDSPETDRALLQSSAQNPTRVLLLRHPAYVIYTSGSTGVPKGVVVTHAGIASLAGSQVSRFELGPDARILQFASLNFDVSLWEFVMAISSGAALVLVRDERGGEPLKDLIVAQRVTHAVLPLGVLATLEEHGELPLRCLINGGEALPADVVARWSPGRNVINAYGPTESTVCATMAGPLSGADVPPIGSPIFNTQVYLLDAGLEPVPVGIAGELYIAGAGLARGYVHRPGLTAERFVANPFSAEAGARMYRTGDLARRRSDGLIDYVGRADQQVKVRGLRVEPGEIENVLKALPDVDQAVVSTREDLPGGRQLVAYIVPVKGASPADADLRQALTEHLPGSMIPAAFVTLDSLPRLPNGKLDRKSLPAPAMVRTSQKKFQPPASALEQTIAGVWQDVLPDARLGIQDNFFDLGGHSLLLIRVHSRLQKALNAKLPMVKLFEHPTIASLAGYLESREQQTVKVDGDAGSAERRFSSVRAAGSEIAIISMACRFPGAPSVQTFWENLKQGVESISSLPRNELDELAALPADLIANPNFVAAAGRLEAVDKFDAALFGLNPAEATATDPQQRLMMECAWEALESAGYNPGGRSIGVFAGAGESLYRDLLRGDPAFEESVGGMQLVIGTGKDHLAPRLSYLLDLRGPSVPVNTACSTSLVAVHIACRSLLNFECEMALAGGVSLSSPSGYLWQEGGILSPDGHCRAFDASAQGTVPGSGAGLVVLKRLEEAVADGDHIHAVIRGSAINNDGNAKVGYTAPSVEGQRAVIERALEASGVKPEQITCIEAHGTATPLGDPIEVEALRQVFAGADSSSRCALGSVKTNIGHCDSAAGIASLIKTVLCVENRTLVPSLHFDRPNPQLDLEHSPFYVSSQTTAWEDEQRLAGVSSFGIGGTNAHVVLGPAPEVASSGPSREWQVFTLSANTEHALEKKKADLARFLTEHPETSLADVAFTLNSGRKALSVRQAFVCRTRDEALAALADPAIRPVRVDPGIGRSVVFLFPGQGKAYADLGQELYRKEVLFCQEVDRCCDALTSLIGADLRDLLFAKDGKLPEQIRRPLFWQPALFVVEYALAKLWMSWGVKPAAMLGHSLGEYVAATLAGVLDLEDALKLVAERARCTELLEAGAMLAVPAGEAQINPHIKDRVSLAAVNAPELCVLAGPVAEIDLLAAELEVFNPIRLEASHAFHSMLVEPIMEPLTRLASAFTLRPPRIPYLSNVSGTWMRDDEATSPGYWAKHLRNTVRFGDCLAEAVRKPGSILLEVGPGKVLSDLARRSFADVPALPSLGEGTPDGLAPARALASLWSAGAAIDWQAFYAGEKRRRVALPAYPFDRQSYWIDSGVTAASIAEAKSSLSVKNAPEDWLYAPTWKRVARRNRFRPEALRKTPECWLVFNDERGIGASLAERLRQAGQTVFEVRSGEAFEDLGDRVFTVNPESPGDYALVLTALREADRLPRRIIHAWGVPSGEPAGNAAEIGTGFDSLIYLAQALAAHQTGDGVRLGIVTANLHRVLDERPSHPAGAAVLGVAAVLPKENPQIVCTCIDVDRDEADAAPPTEEILAEMMADVPEGAVACRRGHRWIPEIDRIEIDRGGTESSLHENGVYIVTHAMQELGFALAERLADPRHARVVLVDKTFFPHRGDWDNWVREQGEDDLISRRIARLKAIRGQVRVLSADAANREQMARLAGEVERDFGAITGVFRLEAAAPTGLIQGKAVPPSAALRKDLAELEAMEEIFARAELRVIISGNMAEIGGLGQSEQAARNGVLGLFAERLAHNGQRTITIELGTRAWSEAEEETPDSGSFIYQQLEEKRRRFGMTTEECLDAIERALAMNDDDPVLSRVIVSTRDFAALMEQQHLFTADFFRRQIQTGPSGNGASGGDLHQRPEISTDYEAPGSDVEKTLSGIWKSTLRFDRIGIHDNFFELGGHSLLALQLLKNINESFSSRITLKDLFSSATVAGIAGLISLANAEPEEDVDELEALLADIEGMPEERLREELRSARKETEVRSHD